jgi:hypothetical protein
MRNSVTFQDEAIEIEKLSRLEEGDKVYTCEYEYDPERGGRVEALEFIFKRYEDPQINHTDVKTKDERVIPAILYKESAPSIEIPQDISVSFYTTPRGAVQSFRDGIAQVVSDCDQWLLQN